MSQFQQAPLSEQSTTFAQEPPAPDEASRHPARFATVLTVLWTMAVVIHILVFLTIGDTQPLGEWLTVIPAQVWLAFVYFPLGLLLLIRQTGRRRWVVPGTLILALAFTVEWVPVLRQAVYPKKPPADVRLVTWNTAGDLTWREAFTLMSPWKADLILLQESPEQGPRLTTETLHAAWPGWHLDIQGELTALSRWPLLRLPTATVGPWSQPQVLAWNTPFTSRPIVLANVRLALPSLNLLPLGAEERNKFSQAHRERIGQYPALQALIQSAARSTSAPAIILAGDFNVDARALSLAPIRETMKDAWTKAGRGWGDTILASFPVARIDHVWYQGSLQASHARTEITSESDHRAVVVELSWNPNANASP